MLQNNIYKKSIYYLKFIYNDFFKDIQYCRKFKEIGGHHEEKLELKQLLFLRVYFSALTTTKTNLHPNRSLKNSY